tara:strand:- start:126 stop:350 length:225 start_codon:yes stop_codon:yes gene_type:complete
MAFNYISIQKITNNKIQKQIRPDNIVTIKFFVNRPEMKAINIDITLGSLSRTRLSFKSKKTAGKIIAGKTAEGT